MGTQADDRQREGARAFGNYIRSLRRNFYGRGRGMSLRQLSVETGIPPSVLSRGERGLQDLRRPAYIERLAAALRVPPIVMKRVGSLVTHEDVAYFRVHRAARATTALWARVQAGMERLRQAPPETLEALATYIEFLASRLSRSESKTG
ncbi:MAG: helix-turn-helix transcriptional regulator [Armatimonadota bacterium]|nr:helix-turn-helix transcriptional regulator [Armatimonadota bacterium]MDR5696694.1 helix-turn-helix transcriptional regulator [Armatimonadota bacterium]